MMSKMIFFSCLLEGVGEQTPDKSEFLHFPSRCASSGELFSPRASKAGGSERPKCSTDNYQKVRSHVKPVFYFSFFFLHQGSQLCVCVCV